ncbi:MAG: ribosome biogenesis GTPase Der [Actinomycetota bacterium]
MTGGNGDLPVVAVVGRPNVGKSSLVNRIIGRREAIVEETPGVTRDRRAFVAEWAGRTFEIFDTGGLEPGAEGLEARVGEQAQLAIEAADVVVLVVDVVAGPLEDDLVVADQLRKGAKPVLVAANKVDDGRDEPDAAPFFRLGLGDVHALSALHGRGSGDFLDALVAMLPETSSAGAGGWAATAIVGRPNVGKSSVLNALLKEERALVDAAPGTTRDPVDSYLRVDDERALRIVDTAGMRRQVQIKDPIEYFGFLRSRQTLTRVDVAVLVIDISEGVTGHDQRIAEAIVEAGRACVIVLNKWDLLAGDDEVDRARLERDVKDRLRFLPWASVVRTSAVTRRGIERILPAIEEAVASHRRRLPTPEVNRIVRDAQERRPHPRTGGRGVRVLYSVQASVGPPTFVLFASGRVEANYLRYIENQVRGVEPFTGSPVVLRPRRKTRDKVES